MNGLREMLDEFKNKYVYIQMYEHTAIVRDDNELIHRILNGMMNRIEAIEQRQKVEDEK